MKLYSTKVLAFAIALGLLVGFFAGMTTTPNKAQAQVGGSAVGAGNYFRLLSDVVSTILSTTGFSVGSTTPNAKLLVQGTSGSTSDVFNAASSTGASLLSVSSFGTTTLQGLNITGSATTTSAAGLRLTGGCFSLSDGVCIVAGTGTVTSIATNNGLTGGTITTSGTLGLAAIAANSVLGNITGASGVPSAVATSTLFTFPWTVGNGGTGAVTLTGLLSGNGTSAITGSATISNTDWSGTDLSVANGGSGASTLTGLLQGNGTSAITGITGTIGQFPYYSGTSALTATSSIIVDTNQRVGVSSTTPQRTLSVGGAIVASECNLTDGATVTFDLSTCNQGRVVLGGNRTLDFTNENQALGQTIRFVACQDATGSRTLTWDAAIRWAGGTAPTLTATVDKCDVIAGFTTGATTTPVILLDKVLNF